MLLVGREKLISLRDLFGYQRENYGFWKVSKKLVAVQLAAALATVEYLMKGR